MAKKSKAKAIPLSRIRQTISIKDGKIYGISQNLRNLIDKIAAEYDKEFLFFDIRQLYEKDPETRSFFICIEKSDDRVRKIFLFPEKIFETDIAHELMHMRYENYPSLFLKNPGKIDQKYLTIRDILLSTVLDFEVERAVDREGFDCRRAQVRDKDSLIEEWSMAVPYASISDEYIRKCRSGCILALSFNSLSSGEKAQIETKAKSTCPQVYYIAQKIYEKWNGGFRSREDFAQKLKETIDILNLNEYLGVAS